MYIIAFDTSIEKAVAKVIFVAAPKELPEWSAAFFRDSMPNRYTEVPTRGQAIRI
jgi:hypothetical protein